jgi:methylthioribose-1-phosphate isomerase
VESWCDGIQTTVITDNMTRRAGCAGKVDLVVVGADRIAANGEHRQQDRHLRRGGAGARASDSVLVAAPLSTVDLATPDGDHIPIEERAAKK